MNNTAYKLRNGKVITVGEQDVIKGIVLVTIEGKSVECEIEQSFGGDLGFCCDGQFVYFRDLWCDKRIHWF